MTNSSQPDDYDHPSQPDDYDPRPMTKRWDHAVLRSELTAWKVLIEPEAHNGLHITYLFVRGLEHYRTETHDLNEEKLLDDVQDFAVAASGGVDVNAIVEDPWFDPKEPGRLALLAAASAVAMKYHSTYDVPPSKVDYDKYAAEALYGNIAAGFQHHPCAAELQRAGAEAIFGRQQEDERGPPKGRAVTGICRLEDGRNYVEMPLTHASRHALARDDDTDAIKSVIKNNCIYIPVPTFRQKLRGYIISGSDSVASNLRENYKNILTRENFDNFCAVTTRIGEQIERIKQANRTQKLFKEQRYGETLRCVLKAVNEAPNELAVLNKWIPARDILDAIEWFTDQVPADGHLSFEKSGLNRNPNIKEYEQHKLSDFNTPEGVTAFLKEHQDHGDVALRQRDHPKPNLFNLSYYHSDVKQVDVQTPDDVFELPCVANLEEHFMQNDPLRRPLYFLVRIILSLENEFEREEIYEIFERFPWYKPDVTEYQVDYEIREGDDVLPVSCRNDNNPHWSEFCIGMENCDYSIWRSLPMKQEIYDDADSGR